MISRLYREEGLALRRTVPRKRPQTTGPDQAWSWDFVTDQLADGRRFRALTVMDVHTRESLAIEPGQRLKGQAAVRVLQSIQRDRGRPKRLFCDNGSEFSSQVLDLGAYQNGVNIDFSRPGHPLLLGHLRRQRGRVLVINLEGLPQALPGEPTRYFCTRPHYHDLFLA